MYNKFHVLRSEQYFNFPNIQIFHKNIQTVASIVFKAIITKQLLSFKIFFYLSMHNSKLFVFRRSILPYSTIIRNGRRGTEHYLDNLPRGSAAAFRDADRGVSGLNSQNWANVFVDYVQDHTTLDR